MTESNRRKKDLIWLPEGVLWTMHLIREIVEDGNTTLAIKGMLSVYKKGISSVA